MRKLIITVAVLAAAGGAGRVSAVADAPSSQELPAAACNRGTATAHGAAPSGSAGHPHIPHSMNGMCMTMPAGHP